MQLKSSFVMSRHLARTGQTIHFLTEAPSAEASHLVGEQLLELCVLLLGPSAAWHQRLPSRLPVLADQIARLRTRLMLAENRDDSVKRFPFICPSFNRGPTPISGEVNYPWQVKARHVGSRKCPNVQTQNKFFNVTFAEKKIKIPFAQINIQPFVGVIDFGRYRSRTAPWPQPCNR